MNQIGTVLPALFKKQIGRADPHLLEILIPLWPRIVGKNLAEHSQPTHFASGLLTLITDSGTWSVQIRHMTEEIRAEINGFLGHAIVKKLRIKTAGQRGLIASTRTSGRTASLATSPPEKTMNTDSIADPEIAAAITNSFVKYFNRPGKA